MGCKPERIPLSFPDKKQDYREKEKETRELPLHPLPVLAVSTRELMLLPVPAPVRGAVDLIKRVLCEPVVHLVTLCPVRNLHAVHEILPRGL